MEEQWFTLCPPQTVFWAYGHLVPLGDLEFGDHLAMKNVELMLSAMKFLEIEKGVMYT